MGWSCRAEASKKMEQWSEKCRLNTQTVDSSGRVTNRGSSNVWGDRKGWYMYEVSRTEHWDGAITGSILKFAANPMGEDAVFANKVGSFRIEPDGTVSKAPKFLKF